MNNQYKKFIKLINSYNCKRILPYCEEILLEFENIHNFTFYVIGCLNKKIDINKDIATLIMLSDGVKDVFLFYKNYPDDSCSDGKYIEIEVYYNFAYMKEQILMYPISLNDQTNNLKIKKSVDLFSINKKIKDF